MESRAKNVVNRVKSHAKNVKIIHSLLMFLYDIH